MAVLAYLKPIEGELWSLFLIFFVNFVFGYLSGMIAKGEDFNFKKAFRCIGEATVFFILCTAIYAIGKFKGQEAGALQCVSFITYTIIYFYSTNVLKNLMKRKGLYGEKQQPIRMDRSDEGRQAITRTIVEGVIKYIES